MSKIDPGEFGPNVWLIDEMYRRFQEDPESVSSTWREFLEDYSPFTVTTANGTGPDSPPPKPKESKTGGPEGAHPLTGVDAVIAQKMTESLGVPTATSVRAIPAKLLEINRNILNNHLGRTRGGKVSFTHLISWAVVRALSFHPGMSRTFTEVDGKPHYIDNTEINLGLAIDVKRPDGGRSLLVPNIKHAGSMGFFHFFSAYEELIRKSDSKKLTPDDFAGTTVTITNPGMIGTVQSVPRLMAGQAAIVGVGAIAFPAEFQAADTQTLASVGIGKVVTLTSTYDHRVIQGAESGEFLSTVEQLLLGEQEFYDEVFLSMGVPYVPVRWHKDVNPEEETLAAEEKQAKVLQLINLYRVRGHLIADLDPLDAKPVQIHPELDPAHHGLTIWDLERVFVTNGLADKPKLPLGEILGILRDAYCRTATVEYMHISDPEQKEWIQERVEGTETSLPRQDQIRILRKLNEAEAFENFLHNKYIGHKRFSLEGAESLIPMLDGILIAATAAEMAEVVVGMSHRGRLNVLANIVGKSYTDIFRQFEGDIDPDSAQGSGDVKYHLGATGTFEAPSGGTIPISVASNPSHLESVDPVVEGMVRAKQDRLDRGEEAPVLPVLLHGDAAFAGQGVVAETLNLSALSGYGTGGTIHIVVNNQLGFTTGSDYGRSSTYATDVAKMVQAPIFHVNGDDPEACLRVARLAFQFRQRFFKDVVIDMWCYRRWGHNEADEPAFTQPLMMGRIKSRRSVRKLYTEMLVNTGDLPVDDAEALLKEYKETLQRAFDETHTDTAPALSGKSLKTNRELPDPTTAVPREVLDDVLNTITQIPSGFNVHPKLAKWLEQRAQALDKDKIDWSLGEALALGSLLVEGVTIRLAGQDTRRGTFSQRHATLVDQNSGEEHTPLARLAKGDARFFIYDSLLSEFAALGFEYGYSVADPDALVVWEAQFGDFANGGQVIIDQFISAGEDKWAQRSGLVMLLPHGYEGQGPEHSSSRLERFLQLAAGDNLQIAVPTTPAQYFHLLRRQAQLHEHRRPLVILTPKSFLRLGTAGSSTADFTEGTFQPVLDGADVSDNARVVAFCAGKIFYDLAALRQERAITDIAIARVEQMYPFPALDIQAILNKYPGAEVRWVQEEPENMGAWAFMRYRFERELQVSLKGVFREESGSPATGSATLHNKEQSQLLEEALG